MSERPVLFLPADGDDGYRWLMIDGEGIGARGDGLPPGDAASPVTVIVPAADVTLHWAALPDRSAAQSVAAARLLVTEPSLAPIAELHVAVGREDDAAERPIAVVSVERMRSWLAELATHGVDPVAMIPAPMLLPRPASGFVRADLGPAAVVRGVNSGFADDAGLTPIVTGGIAPEPMTTDAIEAAILAATAAPPLNLRQGAFARRRRRTLDWPRVRRLCWLAGGLLAVTLAISLVQILRYSFAADALERRADQLARTGLAPGESINDAGRQLDDRLTRLRGAGLGFSRMGAAAFRAVQSVPGSELRMLSFDANGDVRMTLVTQTQGQIVDVKTRLEAMGFVVRPSPFSGGGGRFTGDFTVVAP